MARRIAKRSLLRRAGNAALGFFAVRMLRAIRSIELGRIAGFSAGLMRRIGPWLPEHRVGRANLAAAFPDKPAA